MSIIKITISFIFGIVLAEFDYTYLPLILILVSAVCYYAIPKHKHYAAFILIVAIANIYAKENNCTYFKNEISTKENSATSTLISSRINSLHLSQQSKGLTQALILGKKNLVTKSQVQDVRGAGLSHLFAVSGLHIGIIYLILLMLLRPIGIFGYHCLLRILTITIIWSYVWMIGAPASAIRAATMITISSIAWICARHASSLHILASAALVMLLYNPQQLWDAGFQLSFLAALGIIIVVPAIRHRNFVYRSLIMTISAQVITMPVVAYYFHIVPLFGWLQILVTPLLPVLMYLMIAYILFPSFTLLSYPIDCLSDGFFYFAEMVSHIEAWCLGGKLLWYPSLPETIFLQGTAFLFVIWMSRKDSSTHSYSLHKVNL